MKKVVKYLSIIICTFIISISYVKAASYDVSVTSNTVTVGNSITLTIKGNDLAGKFTLSSSNSGVASLSGSSLWIDNDSKSVTISTSNAGTAVITITPTDVTSYDGNTITGNKTVTITVNSKPTSNPSNGGNKTGTTTTPKPTKKKSSNNNLSSLTIEDYNLDKEFKKEVTEYSVVVENDVKKIKINAQLDDSSAKVEGTGEVEVKEGNNKIEIKVTAEDGSTKTYVINVTVKELNPIEVTIDKKKYTIDQAALDLLLDVAEYYRTQKNFANARTIRNILDQVIMNQNLRTEDTEGDSTIIRSDVEDYIADENIDLQKKRRQAGRIGFI